MSLKVTFFNTACYGCQNRENRVMEFVRNSDLRPERNLVETELLNRFTGNELCEVCMNECMQWCCELWRIRCEMLWLQYWGYWNFNVEKLELQRVGWLYSVCVHKTMTELDTVECPIFVIFCGHRKPIFHWELRICLFWKMSGFPPIFINNAIQNRKIWLSDSARFFKVTRVWKCCFRKKVDELELSYVAKVGKSAAHNFFSAYR